MRAMTPIVIVGHLVLMYNVAGPFNNAGTPLLI